MSSQFLVVFPLLNQSYCLRMILAILSFLQACDLHDIDITVPPLPMTGLCYTSTGHCIWGRCLDINIFPELPGIFSL